ncbi:hypothetical protein [Spirillospora sp. NPDC029432]|uniref:hypothetical protein n=1 Tax=Spirillospora sp. NPDC029432 TaxID=3154599 RepID=UPI0034519F9E
MKRIVGGRRAPARLAVLAAAAAAPLAAVPAQAAPPRAAEVEFRYSDPEFAESGNQVTWRWTIRNRGAKTVNDIKLTHTLTPRLKVSSVSAPCRVRQEVVKCDYAALRPNGEKRGVLVADLPQGASGAVEIKGRVTWRQGTAPATDTASPAPQAAQSSPTSGAPAAPVPNEGAATAVTPPEREDGPEPRPNLNAVQRVP